MLIERCVCGATGASEEWHHGLAMLRCTCGVLRQAVPMDTGSYAAWYETAYHDGVYYHSYDQDRRVAEKRIAAYQMNRGRILDIGCGNAAFVDAANEAGYEAWGQEVAQQIEHERVYNGPLEGVAFPTGHFKSVTVHDVLEHIPEPRAFMAEIRRVLEPDGALYLDFPRFHHPTGKHHWKRVEHLWMLTDEQLVAFVESEGFRVQTVQHPVASKTVLHCRKLSESAPVRIMVPPGIGDGYWVAAKLRAFCEPRGIELPEIWVHDAGPRRAHGYWQRIPFVRWGGYIDAPKGHPVIRAAYQGPDTPVHENVFGCDYLLSFNGTLGAGKSLDAAMPGPTDWYHALFRPKAEANLRDEYRERFGKYVVAAFWSHSFYPKWLAECDEGKLTKVLMRLADAGYTPVIMGAEWDKAGLGAQIAAKDPRIVNLIGETDFDGLTALLTGAAGVFGFPAGNTLLGPYFRVPTLLLWHEHFPRSFWTDTVPPDAPYLPVHTKKADYTDMSDALLELMRVAAYDAAA